MDGYGVKPSPYARNGVTDDAGERGEQGRAAAPGFAGLGRSRQSGLARRPNRRQIRQLGLVALVLVLLGATLGYVATLLVTPQYAAHSDVVYLVTREQPTGFLREDRNLTTQLVVLNSRTVLEPVAAANRIPVVDLAKRVDVALVPESEVIQINLRDPSRDRAVRLLDGIVARYLEVSNNDERAGVQGYLDSQLRDILGRLDRLPPNATDERAPLVEREQDLRSQLDELTVADLAGPAASVLVPAFADADPVYPNRGFAVGTGALAGLLLAVIAVAVLARRMTR